MKKFVLFGIIAGLWISAQAQIVGAGETIKSLGDTVSTTNGVTVYSGFAKSYKEKPAPSTNAAVWKIVRTTYDANGNFTSMSSAYGSGAGDDSLWTVAWTNRVNATYK